MPAPFDVSESFVMFPALDGYRLGGTLFAPIGRQYSSMAALFSCGGGILAARYARFARFVASHGVTILTYDYRGIGKSLPPKLRRFNAVAEDWSELDCGGAIEFLRLRFAHAELIAIAHSIGALVTGGTSNIAEISRFVFICPHTGYYQDYMRRYRIPMALLWHGAMPVVTRLVGYFPAKFLGLGENIPRGVALQWAARRSPELRPEATTKNARRAHSMIARYQHVAGPVLAVGFNDDAFATEAGIQRLLSAFPRLRPEIRILAPSEVGMTSIGHFGFFRREAEPALWPIVMAFILQGEERRLGSAPTPVGDGTLSRTG